MPEIKHGSFDKMSSQALYLRLLQGVSYKAPLAMDMCYQMGDLPVQRFSKSMGSVPVMVKSRACHLRYMSRTELVKAKEESTEMGGYFICNGIERIIRLLIQQRRHYIMALKRGSYQKRGATFTDMATMVRSISLLWLGSLAVSFFSDHQLVGQRERGSCRILLLINLKQCQNCYALPVDTASSSLRHVNLSLRAASTYLAMQSFFVSTADQAKGMILVDLAGAWNSINCSLTGD